MAQQTSSLLATRNELVEERASSAALRAHNVRFEQEAFTSSKKIAELEQVPPHGAKASLCSDTNNLNVIVCSTITY